SPSLPPSRRHPHLLSHLIPEPPPTLFSYLSLLLLASLPLPSTPACAPPFLRRAAPLLSLPLSRGGAAAAARGVSSSKRGRIRPPSAPQRPDPASPAVSRGAQPPVERGSDDLDAAAGQQIFAAVATRPVLPSTSSGRTGSSRLCPLCVCAYGKPAFCDFFL
ncbi:hypothetical protein BRADI_1g71635v3, partial [Brachypodium distachyon]